MLYTVLLLALAGYRLFFYAYVTGRPEYLFAPLPRARRARLLRVMWVATIAYAVAIPLALALPYVALGLYALTPIGFSAALTHANKPKDLD